MSFLAIDKFDADRMGLVTGSRCGVMFPLKGDAKVGKTTYAKQLAIQKFFKVYDEKSTWQTEHGTMAEVFAIDHYRKFIDDSIEEGRFIKSGECGGTTDAEGKDYGIDCKCPTSLENWLAYLFEDVSKDQFHQCQMYMHLTGKVKWEIAAYLTETQFMTDNGLTYPVPEHQRMIRVSVPRNHEWETALKLVMPFLIQERDKFLNTLKERFNGILP
jgi:GTPase SAR1 family protein